jgi:hypothetical protein
MSRRRNMSRVFGKDRFVWPGLSLLLWVIMTGCAQNPQAAKQADQTDDKPGLLSKILGSKRSVTVPEGTDLTVILDQGLSTAQNRPGDTFQASVAVPVVVDGKTVIPQDARVKGHVVEAQGSGRLSGVARLVLTLDSVEVDGAPFPIATEEEGKVGKNHNKRNGVLIGGGAGLGALIGGIAGGGRGALIGGAAGAGAGTAGAAYTGKKEIHVPAETKLTFRLARSATISARSD